MIVRAIDAQNDWLYGKGANDYKKDRDAVAQAIKTRLQSFLGDCFFQNSAGIDWFNLLGSKQIVTLRLSIGTVLLNTPSVLKINELSFNISPSRALTVKYSVDTIFGTIASQSNPNVTHFILSEDGDVLVTEDGTPIRTEQGG